MSVVVWVRHPQYTRATAPRSSTDVLLWLQRRGFKIVCARRNVVLGQMCSVEPLTLTAPSSPSRGASSPPSSEENRRGKGNADEQDSCSTSFVVGRQNWFDDLHYLRACSPFICDLESTFIEVHRRRCMADDLLHDSFIEFDREQDFVLVEADEEERVGGFGVGVERLRWRPVDLNEDDVAARDRCTVRDKCFLIRRDVHPVVCSMLLSGGWRAECVVLSVASEVADYVAVWYGSVLSESTASVVGISDRSGEKEAENGGNVRRVASDPCSQQLQVKRLRLFERRAATLYEVVALPPQPSSPARALLPSVEPVDSMSPSSPAKKSARANEAAASSSLPFTVKLPAFAPTAALGTMVIATHVDRSDVERLLRNSDFHWKWPSVQMLEQDHDVGQLLIQTNKCQWFDLLMLLQLSFPAEKSYLTKDSVKLLLTPPTGNSGGLSSSPGSPSSKRLSRALSRGVPKDVNMTREAIYPTAFRDMFRVFRPAAEVLRNTHLDVDVILFDTMLREPNYVLVRVNPRCSTSNDDGDGDAESEDVLSQQSLGGGGEPLLLTSLSENIARVHLNVRHTFVAVRSRPQQLFTPLPASPRRPPILRVTGASPAPLEKHAKPTIDLLAGKSSDRPIITISDITTTVKSMALRCYMDECGCPTLVIFLSLPIDPVEAAAAPLFQCQQLVSARLARDTESILGPSAQEEASFANVCNGEPRRAAALIASYDSLGEDRSQMPQLVRQQISHCELRPDYELTFVEVETILRQYRQRKEKEEKEKGGRGGEEEMKSELVPLPVVRTLCLLHELSSRWAQTKIPPQTEDEEEDRSDSDDDDPLSYGQTRHAFLSTAALLGPTGTAASGPSHHQRGGGSYASRGPSTYLSTPPSRDVAEMVKFAAATANEVLGDNLFRRWHWFIGKTLRREPSCEEEIQRWRREIRAALKLIPSGDEQTTDLCEDESVIQRLIDQSTTRKEFRQCWRRAYQLGLELEKKRLRDVVPSSIDKIYAMRPCKYHVYCDWRLFSATDAFTEYPSLVFLYLTVLRPDPSDEEELALKSHLEEYIIPVLRRKEAEKIRRKPTILFHRANSKSKLAKEEDVGTDEAQGWVMGELFWRLLDRRLSNLHFSTGDKRHVFATGWITRVISSSENTTTKGSDQVSLSCGEEEKGSSSISIEEKEKRDLEAAAQTEEGEVACVTAAATTVVVYFRCDELSISDNIPGRWVSTSTTTAAKDGSPCVGQCIQLMLRLVDEDPDHNLASKPVLQFLNPVPGTAAAADEFGKSQTELMSMRRHRLRQLRSELEVSEDEQSFAFRGLRATVFCFAGASGIDDQDLLQLVPLPLQQASTLVNVFKQRE